MKHLGGFQSCDWVCDDCGYQCGSPSWIRLDPQTGEPDEDNLQEFKHPIDGIRT